MTFISAIKTPIGIVVASDSLELKQGGVILWQHFDEILKAKNILEDDTTEKISPFELKEKFRTYGEEIDNRIASFDGAKKIFKITNISCLQIAGMADINNKTVDEIVNEITTSITNSGNSDYSNCENIIKQIFETNLKADIENNFSTELIYSGMDEIHKQFEFSHIKWENDWVRGNDKKPVSDDNGEHYRDWFFKKVNHPSAWFCIAGCTSYLGDFDKINRVLTKSVTLEQAFDLSKSLMDLVVTVEKIANKVPRVGGTIRFGIITALGFKFIDSKSDILNF